MLCFSLMATAQTKVGTIDADYIISQMPEAADVNQGLKDYNTQLQNEMDQTIKKYDSIVKNYQAVSADLNDEAKKQEQSKIIGLENDIKSFRQKASVMMQMKRNELSQPLYKKIDKAMREVIAEEGYTQILHAGGNSLAYADERYDITEKVMKKLGIKIDTTTAQQATQTVNPNTSN